ncbi:LysR substrate-binding domain-containing protein [Pseudophaeobacter sp. EL27]|uniref:LysR substrate-binding domain-containing protein n=1 Tax=Pseudophaeobacter sp. EL27 TaxID=2107580 RepID=UPI000EFC8DA7|nr:LysR substrate-binding domain-containing protein [Pseudophaeobacter sp. EL27]
MKRLPPLTSLQAFEAVSRHMSIKLAAEELLLTPTAISHRLKTLETQLDTQLFHRLTRSLKLTTEGAILRPFVSDAFRNLNLGIAQLSTDEVEGELVLTTTRSFAWSWLSPRLPKFSQLYPQLEVKVIASDTVLDFARFSVDVSIRYTDSPDPTEHAAWVLDDYVTPICSRRLEKKIRTAEDLLASDLVEYEWLGFRDGDPNWRAWFASVGIDGSGIRPIASFSDEIMCIEAAMDNRAAALVSIIAASREIERGRIAAPIPRVLKDRSYYLVCPMERAQSAKVRVFQDWLLKEADLFRDSPYGMKFIPQGQH